MKKIFKTISTVVIFAFILGFLIFLYTYSNGGDSKLTLLTFLKNDGLKALIIAVIVSFGMYLLYTIFKIKR